MNLVATLHAAGLVACLFAGGVLDAALKRPARMSFFAAYFALEAACCLFEGLLASGSMPFKALWQGLLMIASLLLGPALWLALQQAIGERPTLAAIGPAQRGLIIAGALLTLPLLATTHGGSGFTDPDRIGRTFLQPLIHETMVACLLLFAIQVPLYLRRCRALLDDPHSERRARWLWIPLAIVFTGWILGMVRTVLGVGSIRSDALFATLALVDVGATVAGAYLIVQALVRTSASAPPATATPSPAGSTTRPGAAPRYARSRLDPPLRQRVRQKIDTAFRVDRLHCRSELSLALLSEAIGEREHYVSQVISEDLGDSFYALLNRHRIEHAQQLLRQSPGLGVLEVAMAVGFNAKSTFNTAFRRCTGMTPRAWRATAVALDNGAETYWPAGADEGAQR